VLVRVVGIAAILAVLALYCYYTAKRLDRLHRRIDAAGAAFDAQLRRRATACAALSASRLLARSDAEALRAAVSEVAGVEGLGHDREIVENRLSRLLADLGDRRSEIFFSGASEAADVHDEALRATIARRFYNDTVRDALVVRDRRAVRWLGLAGRAAHPGYFEMDDEELPAPKIPVASQA
jgi:hypothetical protein